MFKVYGITYGENVGYALLATFKFRQEAQNYVDWALEEYKDDFDNIEID